MNFYGTLRVFNRETLQKWIESGKFQQLLNEGWIYAKGCGRFRSEKCTCSRCRKMK